MRPRWPWACALDVTVVESFGETLRELSSIFGATLRTEYSTQETHRHAGDGSGLVVGAVLIAGAAAPKLVTRDMVRRMKPGRCWSTSRSTRGGCFETSKQRHMRIPPTSSTT